MENIHQIKKGSELMNKTFCPIKFPTTKPPPNTAFAPVAKKSLWLLIKRRKIQVSKIRSYQVNDLPK